MRMSKGLKLVATLAPLLGVLAFAAPAHAAPPSGGAGERHVQGSGVRGDFHQGFHHHDRHDFDRFGFGFGFGFGDPWWGWDPAYYWGYPYPYPYYYPPYPAYYAPPAAPPPQAPIQATGAPPQQFWYYCDNPQGYYPYVTDCSSSWRQVTPTPQSGNAITPKAIQ